MKPAINSKTKASNKTINISKLSNQNKYDIKFIIKYKDNISNSL